MPPPQALGPFIVQTTHQKRVQQFFVQKQGKEEIHTEVLIAASPKKLQLDIFKGNNIIPDDGRSGDWPGKNTTRVHMQTVATTRAMLKKPCLLPLPKKCGKSVAKL